jgi:hypothetical protein
MQAYKNGTLKKYIIQTEVTGNAANKKKVNHFFQVKFTN